MTYELTADKLVLISTDDNGRKIPYVVADLQTRLTNLTTQKTNDIAKFNEQIVSRYDNNIALFTTLISEIAILNA